MPKGRKPKPSHILEMAGAYNLNPNRRRPNEPKASPAPPRCPQHLDRLAKAEWKKICTILKDLGILSSADRAGLELYCQTYSQWRDACEKVAKHGSVLQVKTRSGIIPKRNPFDIIRERNAVVCTRLLVEFGLTPSARTRIEVQQQQDDNISVRERA